MFGVCRVLLIVPLFGCCCELFCWAAAAAIEVLMGGGLGLLLWAREGELPLDDDCVVVAAEGAAVDSDDDEEDDEDGDEEDDVEEGHEAAGEVADTEEAGDEAAEVDIGEEEGVRGLAWWPSAVLPVAAVVLLLLDKWFCATLLIRSEMIVLLLTSQLLGEVGGEVEVGEAEAELELATELQLPVFLDRSVGSFSLAAAEAWWWW